MDYFQEKPIKTLGLGYANVYILPSSNKKTIAEISEICGRLIIEDMLERQKSTTT